MVLFARTTELKNPLKIQSIKKLRKLYDYKNINYAKRGEKSELPLKT